METLIYILLLFGTVETTYPETLTEGELICTELMYRNEPHLQEAFNNLECTQYER